MLANLECPVDTFHVAFVTGWYSAILKNFGTSCEFCICVQKKAFTCMLTSNEPSLGFIGDICHHFNALSCNALTNSGDDGQTSDKSLHLPVKISNHARLCLVGQRRTRSGPPRTGSLRQLEESPGFSGPRKPRLSRPVLVLSKPLCSLALGNL